MTKREKEKKVCSLWRDKRPQNPDGNDMFFFFCWLKKECFELTVWNHMKGDPWQEIHVWLLKEEERIARENPKLE